MNNHQSLRAEIDARDENFTICINLGKDILARGHYRSNEVRAKLMELQSKRGDMMQQWDDKWDYLNISKCILQGLHYSLCLSFLIVLYNDPISISFIVVFQFWRSTSLPETQMLRRHGCWRRIRTSATRT